MIIYTVKYNRFPKENYIEELKIKKEDNKPLDESIILEYLNAQFSTKRKDVQIISIYSEDTDTFYTFDMLEKMILYKNKYFMRNE